MKLYAVFEAGVAGNDCRHVPSGPAIVLRTVTFDSGTSERIVVVTAAFGAVNPHTTACWGARCRTMCEPSVAERKCSFSSSCDRPIICVR